MSSSANNETPPPPPLKDRRPSSPPLPPRKNAKGLPPTYLYHLKGLLHQWLQQQIAVSDGLPSFASRTGMHEEGRLWDEHRLSEVESAIWNGAVIPQKGDKERGVTEGSDLDGKKGLLEIDWNRYALGSARRKEAWKAGSSSHSVGQARESTESDRSTNVKGKPRVPEFETTGKSKLVPPSKGTPSTSPSGASTPAGKGTRSPSLGSVQGFDYGTIQGTAKGMMSSGDADEDEHGHSRVEEWCDLIQGLKGFQRYKSPKKEEWEVVDDDFSAHEHQPELPGAFPQGQHFDHGRQRSSTTHKSIPQQSNSIHPLPGNQFAGSPGNRPHHPIQEEVGKNEILKPIFTLHFPAPDSRHEQQPSSGSTSTIRLRRESASGSADTHSGDPVGGGSGSKGIGGKTWWGGRRASEMTVSDVKPGNRKIEVDFLEGRFALPVSPSRLNGDAKRGKHSRRTTRSDSQGAQIALSGSRTASPASDSGEAEDEDDDDDDNSSVWSGTQRAHSRTRRRKDAGYTTVLSGGEIDLPMNGMDGSGVLVNSEEMKSEKGKSSAEASVEDVETDLSTDLAGDAGQKNDEQNVVVVGGTIVVKGIQDTAERQAVEKVFRVLLYTIQAMYLELELLDGFRVPREPDPLPVPPKTPDVGTKHRPSTPTSESRRSTDLLSRSSSLKHKGERGSRSGGLFHRLGRESRGVWEGLLGKSKKGHGGHGQSFQSSARHDVGVMDDDPPTMSTFGNSTSPLFTPLPIKTIQLSNDQTNTSPDRPGGLLPPNPATTAGFEHAGNSPIIQLPIERHLQILAKLEKILPSTTPNLKIPMPPLLLRVREEDRIRSEKAREEASIDGLPGSGIQTADAGNGGVDVKKGRAMGYRLGGDVRAGLGVLATGLEEFEGWLRLQKLDTLISFGVRETSEIRAKGEVQVERAEKAEEKRLSGEAKATAGNGGVSGVDSLSASQTIKPKSQGIVVCQTPKSESLVFWNPSRGNDQTISEFLKAVAITFGDRPQKETNGGDRSGERSGHECSRPGCGVPLRKHEMWWLHSGKRVSLKLHALERSITEKVREGKVEVWVGCSECEKESKPRKLGGVAELYSWGKLLELLFYTNVLHPPDLCIHCSKSTIPQPLIHHFRTSQIHISISVETITVMDTRLPKLQVGPNVPKRKGGKGVAEAALDGIAKRENFGNAKSGEDAAKPSSMLREEIERFYISLEKRVGNLKLLIPSMKPTSDKTKPSETVSKEAIVPSGALEKRNEMVDSLTTLATDFRRIESRLYDTLTSASSGQLNDVRRQLVASIKSSTAKLEAWQKKYGIEKDFGDQTLALPEYALNGKVHPLPGSSVLIREDEPASIIAYTLSSLAYFNELTNTSKSSSQEDQANVVSKISEANPTALPDGEQIETWTIKVQRKDTPRDLLSLRSLAKKKSDASMTLPSSKLPMSLTPAPNAPSLELSLEQVEGKSQAGDRLGDFVRNISKATAQDPILTYKRQSPSAVSDSESLAGAVTPKNTSPSKRMGLGRRPTVTDTEAPPSAFRPRVVSVTLPPTPITPITSSSVVSSSATMATPTATREGWSSVTSSLGSSFTQLMKLGSDVGDSLGSFRIRSNDRSLSSLIGPLSIMSSMDNSLASFDDRPHIQFTYSLGERLKLSCTVYYATAFDSLRRRCAVDKSIISSLARTSSWDAQGGKSKASFFITNDKKYIVKELVSKWNVSDTHALLEIAPAYFEHLAGTHNKATSLAKIVGFYSVRIHDLQASTKRQLNLLVMENLFYKHDITQTYDLKGIEGRKVVKPTGTGVAAPTTPGSGGGSGSTLFDGDWLEGQQRSPILLQPHAKRILQDAITNDTRFLSSQSIMDYSLLLGLDEGRKELVVGLVDAIGSYNLFKTIESRGKLALNRGGEVTIIPPDQYRERFETAMKQYFIACPDKWSKTPRKSGLSATTSSNLPSII